MTEGKTASGSARNGPEVHLCDVCGADAPYGFGDSRHELRGGQSMLWACGAHRDAVEAKWRGLEQQETANRLSDLARRKGQLL